MEQAPVNQAPTMEVPNMEQAPVNQAPTMEVPNVSQAPANQVSTMEVPNVSQAPVMPDALGNSANVQSNNGTIPNIVTTDGSQPFDISSMFANNNSN